MSQYTSIEYGQQTPPIEAGERLPRERGQTVQIAARILDQVAAAMEPAVKTPDLPTHLTGLPSQVLVEPEVTMTPQNVVAQSPETQLGDQAGSYANNSHNTTVTAVSYDTPAAPAPAANDDQAHLANLRAQIAEHHDGMDQAALAARISRELPQGEDTYRMGVL
jgi:hypothetical protein